MADIKLYYFPVRGRAEPMRLVLAAAGKKFDDVRVTGEQWATTEKAKAPYGQIPYIVCKGKTYGESKAIASYVARECGMAGKSSEDAMRVDEVFCLTVNILEALGKAHFEKDAAKKAEFQKTLVEETVPKNLGFLTKLLKENGSSGYFVGNTLSLADLSCFDITDSLLKMNPKVLDSCPEIQKVRKNVEANKNVQAYLASRPASDM